MPSRRERQKKPPEPEPVFFVNRSLGKKVLPGILRADGWQLRPMFEEFGEQMGQGLDDPPWIEYACDNDLAILTKDFKSLRYRAPFETIKERGARVFALGNAGLLGPEQARWFQENKATIYRHVRKPGPYIYKVFEDRVDKAWP